MNKLLKKNCLIILFLFGSIYTKAQTNDNILWSKFSVKKVLNKNTSILFAPIIRFNEDLSKYQNISLDYSVKQVLSPHWSAQLSGRTWFLPNGTNRQFIWPDINYTKKLKNTTISSRLRYHYAIDIKNREDPDFIRWSATITLPAFKKFQFYFAIEPWLRLNKINQLQRIRYQPGLKYKLSNQLSASITLWRQESINLSPEANFNIYVLNLSYIIPSKMDSANP